MQEYVVGFMSDGERVALIEKKRPEWQAGRLNGIGGHVERYETPLRAMRREFVEETGVWWPFWDKFVVMTFPEATIHFYRAFVSPEVLDTVHTTTDERVGTWSVSGLPYELCIPNLTWLVPLSLYRADRYEIIKVRATVAEEISGI